MNATMKPATPKQVALIERLVHEGRGAVERPAALSIPEASATITRLLQNPPALASSDDADAPAAEVGMYRVADGSIYKVQRSKTTDSLYAKRLVPITGSRLSETDERVQWEFVYAPGAIRDLTAAQRLTLAEAQAFGIRFGVCSVCGRTLVDADSVAAGIGPVCAKRLSEGRGA